MRTKPKNESPLTQRAALLYSNSHRYARSEILKADDGSALKTYLISDVIDDDVRYIGSGPTCYQER